MHTAVAFTVFNRPDLTQRVFEVIQQVRPPKLFLIADGPRPDHPGENELCQAARTVVEHVNWPCEVSRNYSEINLGLKQRASTGLNWVFQNVEEAIVLEDDTLPSFTFFRFCEELLERYRDDERIMHISGDNFQFNRRRSNYSYYFSYFFHPWGWASWRRAWKYFDPDMTYWDQLKQERWLIDLWGDVNKAAFWTGKLDRTARGQVIAWDHQWWLACWSQNGLSILPDVNLVTNIGFDHRASTPPYRKPNVLANVPLQETEFPLRHPPFMIRDRQADDHDYELRAGRKIGRA